LTVTGQVVAQTLNVQQVTSSIVFSSGSNIFGNSLANTQQFTGSLQVSGSTHHILGSVGVGTTSLVADALLPLQINAGASGQAYFASNNNGNYGLLMGYDNANGYARIRNVSNTALTFETNNSEKLRLDSSGNLGLGVTPSAWDSTVFKGIQIASSNAFIMGRVDGAANQVQLGSNAYYNADGNFKFINNGYATRYVQTAGIHFWDISTLSGTAGNNVTFTQAMTLSAAGRLLIGKTNDDGYTLDVVGTGRISGNSNSAFVAAYLLNSSTGTSARNILQFGNNVGNNGLIELFGGGFSGSGGGDDVADGFRILSGGSGGLALRSSAGSLRFYTGSSERLTIASTGTATFTGPALPMAIASTNATELYTEYRYNTSTVVGYIGNGTGLMSGGGNDNFGIRAQNSLVFSTLTTERMRITSDGNVGIGTTPSYRLHVVTDAVAGKQNMSNISRTTGNWVRFTNPQFSTDSSMGLILKSFPDSDGRQGAGIIASGGSNNASTDLDLFVTTSPDGSGGTSYSAIKINGFNGNVGIGTTSPSQLLHLQTTLEASSGVGTAI
jgi:hypothetical protein